MSMTLPVRSQEEVKSTIEETYCFGEKQVTLNRLLVEVLKKLLVKTQDENTSSKTCYRAAESLVEWHPAAKRKSGTCVCVIRC